MENRQTSSGETRVVVFATPTLLAGSPRIEWGTIEKTFSQNGAHVYDQCSAVALGNQHGELIIQAGVKDYAKVPQLIAELREIGLSASVYPSQNPATFVRTLGQGMPATTSTR